MLELTAVTATQGDRHFTFDLEVEAGSWVAIVGPSGAGKSTLLNLIAGFVAADSGSIRVAGAEIGDVPPYRRPVTTLFQDHNLFVHLSVAENVGLGVNPALRLGAADRVAVEDALGQVSLGGRGDTRPGALSGGERQRVGLARALVRRQPLLLLDEPLSQLDPATRHDMLELIADLHDRVRPTILMVLHTPEDALGRVDRYIHIEDGRIAATFRPEDLRSGSLPESVLRYLGITQEPASL